MCQSFLLFKWLDSLWFKNHLGWPKVKYIHIYKKNNSLFHQYCRLVSLLYISSKCIAIFSRRNFSFIFSIFSNRIPNAPEPGTVRKVAATLIVCPIAWKCHGPCDCTPEGLNGMQTWWLFGITLYKQIPKDHRTHWSTIRSQVIHISAHQPEQYHYTRRPDFKLSQRMMPIIVPTAFWVTLGQVFISFA